MSGFHFIDILEGVSALINSTVDSREKRHLLGGTLISASLMFAGLAITVMTLRKD